MRGIAKIRILSKKKSPTAVATAAGNDRHRLELSATAARLHGWAVAAAHAATAAVAAHAAAVIAAACPTRLLVRCHAAPPLALAIRPRAADLHPRTSGFLLLHGAAGGRQTELGGTPGGLGSLEGRRGEKGSESKRINRLGQHGLRDDTSESRRSDEDNARTQMLESELCVRCACSVQHMPRLTGGAGVRPGA
jgi:hypothetical protein